MTTRAAAMLAAIACAGCQHVAWYGHVGERTELVRVVSRCGEEFVEEDAHEHASFDAVASETLVVSARGSIAYAAHDESGWWLVVDGRRVVRAFDRVAYIGWAGDTEAAIAVLGDGAGDRVVVARREGGTDDGSWRWIESAPFEGIADGSFITNENGSIACVGLDHHAGRVLVIDPPRDASPGHIDVGPPYDGVATLALSKRGSPSYVARSGAEAYVVRRGRAEGPFDDVAALYSDDDGERVVALVRTADGWVADDGTFRSRGYDRIGDVVLSHPGSKLAFRGKRGDDEFVIVEGEELGPYRAVVPGTLHAGGPHDTVAFAVRDGGGERVVVDGHAGELWSGVDEIAIGDDGRVGFVARAEGTTLVVIDGEKLGAWSWAGELHVARGGSVFLAHERGHDVVVSNGTAHTFDEILRGTLVVTPDASDWGAVGVIDGGLAYAWPSGIGARIDLEEMIGEVLRTRTPGKESALLQRWVTMRLAARGKR